MTRVPGRNNHEPTAAPNASYVPALISLPLVDEIVLVTLPGVIPTLERSVRRASPSTLVLSSRRASLLLAIDGPLSPLLALPTFSSCGPCLGDVSRVEHVSSVVERAANSALIDALSSAVGRSLRFRVGSPGLRRSLQGPLETELGWINDPRAWDVNLIVIDGSIVAETGVFFRSRRLGELLRTDTTTTPVAAALMAELAAIPDGARVADPFCGSATLLLEAARTAQPAELIGSDLDAGALRTARINLEDPPVGSVGGISIPQFRLHYCDARVASRMWKAPVDRVLADLPFGKRIGKHSSNSDLYYGALRAIDGSLAPDGVVVVMTEHKTALREAVRRIHTLQVRAEHVITLGGLHPSIYVIKRPSGTRRRRNTPSRRLERAKL